MTERSFVPKDGHADVLMTPDVAVAGWRSLSEPDQRWDWFEKLYQQAAHLDRRYRLALRSGWWEDEIQVELLAALGAWVGMFDYANWADPGSQDPPPPSAAIHPRARTRGRAAIRSRTRPRSIRTSPTHRSRA